MNRRRGRDARRKMLVLGDKVTEFLGRSIRVESIRGASELDLLTILAMNHKRIFNPGIVDHEGSLGRIDQVTESKDVSHLSGVKIEMTKSRDLPGDC